MHFSHSCHLFTEAITWKLNGTCGGELQAYYRGQWEPVCPLEDSNDAAKICRELKCGNASHTKAELIKEGTTDIGMKCKNEHNDLRHCFKSGTEACTKKAVIYCDGKCRAVVHDL